MYLDPYLKKIFQVKPFAKIEEWEKKLVHSSNSFYLILGDFIHKCGMLTCAILTIIKFMATYGAHAVSKVLDLLKHILKLLL